MKRLSSINMYHQSLGLLRSGKSMKRTYDAILELGLLMCSIKILVFPSISFGSSFDN